MRQKSRLEQGVFDYARDIGAAVNNPSQSAKISVLTQRGWQSKRTNLSTARAWDSYLQRNYPQAPRELVIFI
jgi:hypothetical protein